MQVRARASQSVQEPRQRLAGTWPRGFAPMARDMRHRDPNGRTEGFKNTRKLIQRMAYGRRNAHNRRKRI